MTVIRYLILALFSWRSGLELFIELIWLNGRDCTFKSENERFIREHQRHHESDQ